MPSIAGMLFVFHAVATPLPPAENAKKVKVTGNSGNNLAHIILFICIVMVL
jgi:hypothetical protein